MEKVWEELKRIEAEAEKIRADAQSKAQNIMTVAQENSEKLLANSQAYAEEEGRHLSANAVGEANRKKDEQLKANHVATEKLKTQAGKNMEAAVTKIFDAVVKEARPWAKRQGTLQF